MKYIQTIALVTLGVIGLRSSGAAVPAQQEPLIQSNNLTYVGSFRLPEGTLPNSQYGFGYAETGFAFNPANGTLFINNHIYEQKTAEINIPSLTTNLNNIQTATFRQNPADITEGHLGNILAGGGLYTGSAVNMGGLFVHNNRLIGTSYGYYDASHAAALSHFTHSLNVSQTGSFQGMYKVGTLNQGYYAGFMAAIPPQWQPFLGGPVLTGLTTVPIVSRTSLGPAAFVFNPDHLGAQNPVTATPLVYYDSNHPTLGTWDNVTVVNQYYNMGTKIKGMAFPVGTRSLLFFGRQGLGVPCYGEGGATPPGGAVHWCYDPANTDKGNHAYPYDYWVWAYDAVELQAVKDGAKNPWDVRPYAIWALPLPIPQIYPEIQGVAYDAATQRIYVSQMNGGHSLPGGSQFDASPVIHVFQVNNSPPPPPTPCDVNHDGTTGVNDVQLCANMATGSTTCTGDINLDGRCDIVDVQRVVNAALGGSCVSP